MSKLFKLKEWHSLEYSANYLTKKLNESFLPADILRMAIEGRLTVSVYFANTVPARCGRIASKGTLKSGDFSLKSGELLIFKDELIHINGIYDLPMIGGEIFDCEHKIQELSGRQIVLLMDFRGAFVRDFHTGNYYQLLYKLDNIDTFKHLGKAHELWGYEFRKRLYYHAFLDIEKRVTSKKENVKLTKDREDIFVVRTSALQDFIDLQMVSETDKVGAAVGKAGAAVGKAGAAVGKAGAAVGKAGAAVGNPLMKRERDTLLTIIAALARAAKITIDYKSPGKSSIYISGLTVDIGAHVSVRAIDEHLKKIPEALRGRTE